MGQKDVRTNRAREDPLLERRPHDAHTPALHHRREKLATMKTRLYLLAKTIKSSFDESVLVLETFFLSLSLKPFYPSNW